LSTKEKVDPIDYNRSGRPVALTSDIGRLSQAPHILQGDQWGENNAPCSSKSKPLVFICFKRGNRLLHNIQFLSDYYYVN